MKDDNKNNDLIFEDILCKLKHPVIINDLKNSVIYTNPEYNKLISCLDNAILDYLKELDELLNRIVLNYREELNFILNLPDKEKKYIFEVNKFLVQHNNREYIFTLYYNLRDFFVIQDEIKSLYNYLEVTNLVTSKLIFSEKPLELISYVLETLSKLIDACYSCIYEVKVDDNLLKLKKLAHFLKKDEINFNIADSIVINNQAKVKFLEEIQAGRVVIHEESDVNQIESFILRSGVSVYTKLYIPLLYKNKLLYLVEFGRCEQRESWKPKQLEVLQTCLNNFLIATIKHKYLQEYNLLNKFIQESNSKWLILDADYNILFANKSFYRFFNISDDISLIGKKYTDILPKQVIQNELSLIQKAISEKETINIDDIVEDANGIKRYLSKVIMPIFDDSKNNLLAVGLISRDITELEKLKSLVIHQDSELSLLLSAINQLPISVVLTDANGYIEYANPAFEKITGYSREEYIGKKTNILKSGKHPEEFYKQMWETISAGKIWKGHIINKRKDGTLYDEETTIVPIIEKNIITGYIAIKEDITQKVLLEKQLIQAQKLETAAIIAGGMAHDFNNILGSIQNILENMILKNELNKDSIHVQKIYKLIDRAKGITNQILLISKPIMEEPTVININNTINDIINILKETTDRKISFITVLSTEPIIIKIDQSLLTQLLLNILINSIHALPNGGYIKITTKKIDSSKLNFFHISHQQKYVEIQIEDNGIGMDEYTLNHIFDPFFTTKPPGKGTGLGMTIVNKIVKNLKGEIFIESEVNKGTKVTIYIPLEDDLLEYTYLDTKEELIEPLANNIDRNIKILIVDDEDFLRESMVEGLKEFGYIVKDFKDGLEAIKEVKDKPNYYDICILDMNMPGLNGLEVLEKIREINQNIPAILATGYATDDKIKAFIAKENTKMILKPFRLVELESIIRQMVK